MRFEREIIRYLKSVKNWTDSYPNFSVKKREINLLYESEKPESEVKSHIRDCDVCKASNLDNFDIMQKCNSDQEVKINEAFFISRQNPRLNKNLFNKGSFYTLKVYS